MKQFIICFLFFIFSALNIFSQNSLDDLNIIFKHDFENNTLGYYRNNEWNVDFRNPLWSCRQSALQIVQDASNMTNNTKSLHITYPANSLGPDEGGTYWWTFFDPQDELYMSYDFQFQPGFQFQLGGKLPSFQAGELGNEDATGYNCFTGGLMFNSLGNLTFYVYYPDSKQPTWGETFLWGTTGYSAGYFSPSSVVYEYGTGNIANGDPGKWHNITYRMVANSVKSEGVGNYDGILEAYFDGVLISQISHFLFRKTANLKLDRIRMVTFFGGDNDAWRNPVEEWLNVDNIMLFTFKDGFNVTRGNNLSPRNRTINYWRNMVNQSTTLPEAPSNLNSNSITTNSATITWNDNASNEYGFEIYRSIHQNSDYIKVGTVLANITSFQSNSLDPNTTYYYQIRAYNGKGFSAYAGPLAVKTQPLAPPPSPPTALIIKSFDATNAILEWHDNSNDEYGFEVFRSLLPTSGYDIIGTTPANSTIFTSSSLNPSTTYYFSVRSYNGNGKSNFSPAAQVTTLNLEIPAPPSTLRLISSSEDSVLVQWDDNSDFEDGFVLEKSEGDSNHFIKLYTSNFNQTTFKDKNIQSNNNYYRVKSFNAGGFSSYSNTLFVYLEGISNFPNSPINFRNKSTGVDNITLQWKDNSDNETGFEIQRFGPDDKSIVNFIKVDANDSSFIDNRLKSNADYSYYIRAFNENGYSGYSDKIIVHTSPIDIPAAPSSVQVISSTEKSITLQWADNSDNENVFYIKRSLIFDTNVVKIITLNANVVSYTDTALNPNTDFIYQIFAGNQAGNSPSSNEAIATTLSLTETKRVKDGLIAYYNFHYYPDNIIRDMSEYKEPLDLKISDPNSVVWHPNNSLEIINPTSIISNAPATKIIDSYKNSKEMTVECWIKPSEPSSSADSKIISLDNTESDVGFVVSQNYSNLKSSASFDYSIRLHTKSTSESGYPEFSLNKEINYINLQHIVYVRDSLWNEKIYLNGTLYEQSYRPNNFEDWNNNYFLNFGNASDQNSPWLGTFYLLALYDRALSDSQVVKNYLAGPEDNLVVYKNDFSINISPNPVVSNRSTFEIIPAEIQDIAPETIIRIMDMFGKQYHEEILFNPGEMYSKEMDFTNYPKGIYIIQVLSKDKQQFKKFIIE
jgi:hypothetical protein